MISEISEGPDISFEQFRAMRVLQKPCELNVLAEFKKFAIHKVHRNAITRDCILKVLDSECCPNLEK